MVLTGATFPLIALLNACFWAAVSCPTQASKTCPLPWKWNKILNKKKWNLEAPMARWRLKSVLQFFCRKLTKTVSWIVGPDLDHFGPDLDLFLVCFWPRFWPDLELTWTWLNPDVALIWTHFWPYFDSFWTPLDPDLDPFFNRFWLVLYRFGPISDSFCTRIGLNLDPFWTHFDPFWTHLSPF